MTKPTVNTKPVTGAAFIRTLTLALLSIALLFAVDTFLAKSEHAETAVQAATLFERAQALMRRGNNLEAIKQLKDAVSMERANRDYRRTLAEAQLAAGKPNDAETTLSNLLETDSTDGPANRIMGRTLLANGRFNEATSYFHRAIFGRWDADPPKNRLSVRFELIDLLAANNSKEELLAELLPLEDSAPADPATRLRIGRLFLLAGSPVRAAAVFHGILRDTPDLADAFAGLGEAEFAQGNYRAAESNFQSAVRLAPGEKGSEEGLQRSNELLRLDPMTRDIGTEERLRRSRELVRLTLAETSRCIGTNLPSGWRELELEAETLLNASRNLDSVETNLELSERIWQLRKTQCKPPPESISPLTLVLAKISK